MKYDVFRDLVLVKKVNYQESAIILPEARGQRFLRLEVLGVGPDVKEEITKGSIVLAENMFEEINPKDKSIGLILSKYIVAEEVIDHDN